MQSLHVYHYKYIQFPYSLLREYSQVHWLIMRFNLLLHATSYCARVHYLHFFLLALKVKQTLPVLCCSILIKMTKPWVVSLQLEA